MAAAEKRDEIVFGLLGLVKKRYVELH
jgi:hypothetical protein